MSTTKKNSIILEGAAVYAVSLDSSLRRLQTEYDLSLIHISEPTRH